MTGVAVPKDAEESALLLLPQLDESQEDVVPVGNGGRAPMAFAKSTLFLAAALVLLVSGGAGWAVVTHSVGATVSDPRQLTVGNRLSISTPQGVIWVNLRPDAAPQTVDKFKKMVQTGLYNNCVFYRAEAGQVVQGGLKDAAGNVKNNPLGTFPLEYKLPNKRGTLTMARYDNPNSGNGEFFINLQDRADLGNTGGPGYGQGFAVFGEVFSGIEIVNALSNLPTHLVGSMHMLNAPVVFTLHVQ